MRLSQNTKSETAENAAHPRVGGTLNIGPIVSHHPVTLRQFPACPLRAMPKRERTRLHLLAIASRYNNLAEIMSYAEMRQQGVRCKCGLGGINAEHPAARAQLLKGLCNMRVKPRLVNCMLAVMRHENAPQLIDIAGMLRDCFCQQMPCSKPDVADDLAGGTLVEAEISARMVYGSA